MSKGEFEIAYEPSEDSELAVEGGFGTVVAMDTAITESLRLDGVARDLVRSIQDLRKEAGYSVSDRIELCLTGASSLLSSDHFEYVARETLSEIVSDLTGYDASKEVETEIGTVSVFISKA